MISSLLSALVFGALPVYTETPNIAYEHSQMVASLLTVAPVQEEIDVHMALSASGVLVVDRETGQELFSHHGAVQRPMASLTKLMTALIIVENHSLSDIVRIPEGTDEIGGSSAHLSDGHRFTVGDLLTALLLASGNDAAHALAVYHSGTPDAFVEEMNARAEVLGLTSTRYANVSGLDDARQWTSPRDIATLTRFTFGIEPIANRLSKTFARITSLEGKVIPVAHTHQLLREYSSILAGKTGTTTGAGECLVSIVEYNGRDIVIVLLQSSRRYDDMRLVLDILS